jgi:hypothetical protein
VISSIAELGSVAHSGGANRLGPRRAREIGITGDSEFYFPASPSWASSRPFGPRFSGRKRRLVMSSSLAMNAPIRPGGRRSQPSAYERRPRRRPVPPANRRSATRADAVVDAVILLPDGAVERRWARRLRNAGRWDGLADRRQIVVIEKMPRHRSAEFRGDVPAVALGIRRNAISAVKMMTISANLSIVSSCSTSVAGIELC